MQDIAESSNDVTSEIPKTKKQKQTQSSSDADVFNFLNQLAPSSKNNSQPQDDFIPQTLQGSQIQNDQKDDWDAFFSMNKSNTVTNTISNQQTNTKPVKTIPGPQPSNIAFSFEPVKQTKTDAFDLLDIDIKPISSGLNNIDWSSGFGNASGISIGNMKSMDYDPFAELETKNINQSNKPNPTISKPGRPNVKSSKDIDDFFNELSGVK